MIAIPTLTTERLLLREWRDRDVEPYGRMLAHPDARFIVRGGEPV